MYVRVYPNKSVAGQIIGYTGRTSRNADGIIENGQVLWPETEGREGLEQTFNTMLTGRHGKYKVTFDRDGRKTSERDRGTPGARLQHCHHARSAPAGTGGKVARRRKPNAAPSLSWTRTTAISSPWPRGRPSTLTNSFPPSRPQNSRRCRAIQTFPLLPRAYRSAYPPGSTFKVAVGLAALESNTITPQDEYECVPAMDVGNTTFHNWKNSDRGSLNFVQALTESCDTWFYQAGIETGAGPILEWAAKLGFGAKSGIPLKGEAEGRLPRRPIHEGNPRPENSQWRHRQYVDRPGRSAGHAAPNGAGHGDRGERRNILSDPAG